MTTARRLRIALIASDRYPIREPFAGGLEAQTWSLAEGLHKRGHEVSLFAASGSDPRLVARLIAPMRMTISAAARDDVSMTAGDWLAEHHAYLGLMLKLMDDGGRSFDVVHNNSLHHLPVAMARAVCVPSVTTLHTPPTPWLESAIGLGPCPVSFVAVSASTAKAWQHVVPRAQVVLNGIDLSRWVPGPGGGPLVWFGRLVPEKGAHLAVAAARAAGLPLQLVGPRADPAYFDVHVAPLLGDGIGYRGHLSHAELVEVVGGATATVVTPRWDEPYGLVAAESLACGTPVVAFDRGGLHEVVDDRCALLVPPDDVDALAGALVRAETLDRGSARRRAEQHCSAERMVDEYERLYRRLSPIAAA